MNKNLLELNKKIIENLNIKEMNGEIYLNLTNCKYIKQIDNNIEHYNSILKTIEDNFSNDYFEFDEEKQKSKLLLWKIPLIISVKKSAKELFSKNIDKKKMLVHHFMTIKELYNLIRLDLIKKEDHFFLIINKITFYPGDMLIKEIYDKYKKKDNILYINIEGELMWG